MGGSGNVSHPSVCECWVTSSTGSHVQLLSNHLVTTQTVQDVQFLNSTIIIHTGLDVCVTELNANKMMCPMFSSARDSQPGCSHSTGNLTASSSSHIACSLWQRQSEKRSPLYRPPGRRRPGGGCYVT